MPEYIDKYLCHFENDTLINSVQYRKLSFEKHRWHLDEDFNEYYLGVTSGYAGAIREVGYKYYLAPRNSTNELLIYDFENYTIGDIVLEDLTGSDILEIDDIYLETMEDNSVRKVYSGHNTSGNEYFKLTEGMGVRHAIYSGLIPTYFLTDDYLMYDGGFLLQVFCHNHAFVYCRYDCSNYTDCNYGLNVEEEFLLKNKFLIYPNPTSDYIKFAYNEEIYNDEIFITMINSIGQKILSAKISNKSKIDLTGLKKGVYLIKINSGDNEFLTSKIIIK